MKRRKLNVVETFHITETHGRNVEAEGMTRKRNTTAKTFYSGGKHGGSVQRGKKWINVKKRNRYNSSLSIYLPSPSCLSPFNTLLSLLLTLTKIGELRESQNS